MRSNPRRALAAGVLVFESLVVLFAGLVARGLAATSDGTGVVSSGGTELAICAGLALVCVTAAGLLRRPAGYLFGSVLQIAVVATGFWVPAMFFLGAVFGLLWVVALRVGSRIERERAAAETPSSGM